MTKVYRFLAIAGLWMMQAAYADIGTATGEQLTTERDGPGSGVSAKRDPHVCVDAVLKRLRSPLEMTDRSEVEFPCLTLYF